MNTSEAVEGTHLNPNPNGRKPIIFCHSYVVFDEYKMALPVRGHEINSDGNTPDLYDRIQQLHSEFSPTMHDSCYILLHSL